MSQVPEVHIDWYLGKSPLPEIIEEDLVDARENPNSEFVYWDPNHPRSAPKNHLQKMGIRIVGPDGTLTGEEWRNPEFVPHLKTAGGEFFKHFELQIWRTTHGYLRLGQFAHALAEAELLAMCDEHGELKIQPNEHGDLTLDVYTDRRRVPEGSWPHWTPLSGKDIVETLGRSRDHLGIQFNRDAWPGLRMPAQTLSELWRAYDQRVREVMQVAPLPTSPTTMGTVTAGGQL